MSEARTEQTAEQKVPDQYFTEEERQRRRADFWANGYQKKCEEAEELRTTLLAALEWNWLDHADPPPRRIIVQVYKALGEEPPDE